MMKYVIKGYLLVLKKDVVDQKSGKIVIERRQKDIDTMTIDVWRVTLLSWKNRLRIVVIILLWHLKLRLPIWLLLL